MFLRNVPYRPHHMALSERPANAPCPACEAMSLGYMGNALVCHGCGWHSSQLGLKRGRSRLWKLLAAAWRRAPGEPPSCTSGKE